MDVDRLIAAGLVSKQGDKIFMTSAQDRRRTEAVEREEILVDLFGEFAAAKRRRRKSEVLQVHPNDPTFRTAIDACHALSLRYWDAQGGSPGIGNARALVRQQGWSEESSVAKLMSALVKSAPRALRKEDGKNSPAAKFPEFRAWYALLEPLFGIAPPDWTEPAPPDYGSLFAAQEAELEAVEEELEDDEEDTVDEDE